MTADAIGGLVDGEVVPGPCGGKRGLQPDRAGSQNGDVRH